MHGNNLFYNNMNLVGSRCGGYDFNIVFNGVSFWLGQRPNSDYDYFLHDNEKPSGGGDFWHGRLGFFYNTPVPFINDFGRLEFPSSKDFISLIMERKFLAKKMFEVLYRGIGKDIFVYDNGFNFAFKTIFKPKIIPRCQR